MEDEPGSAASEHVTANWLGYRMPKPVSLWRRGNRKSRNARCALRWGEKMREGGSLSVHSPNGIVKISWVDAGFHHVSSGFLSGALLLERS